MKQLLIYCHPQSGSFCRAIADTAVQAIHARGDEVMMRDLYAMHFVPALSGRDLLSFAEAQTPPDIIEEQRHIAWADRLIFVYPLWWSAMPAVLKGYIDRVFAEGFAFSAAETGLQGLLAGKEVLAFTTMGMPEALCEESGVAKSVRLAVDEGIISLCGMKVLEHRLFGAVTTVDDAARQKMLEEVSQKVRTL